MLGFLIAEDELAAARQEILLLSKLTKARRRESVLLSDPTQMAGKQYGDICIALKKNCISFITLFNILALLVRMAQRDGEMGEKASAALCSAICGTLTSFYSLKFSINFS